MQKCKSSCDICCVPRTFPSTRAALLFRPSAVAAVARFQSHCPAWIRRIQANRRSSGAGSLDAGTLRWQTADLLLDRADIIVADTVAVFPFSAPQRLEADYCIRLGSRLRPPAGGRGPRRKPRPAQRRRRRLHRAGGPALAHSRAGLHLRLPHAEHGDRRVVARSAAGRDHRARGRRWRRTSAAACSTSSPRGRARTHRRADGDGDHRRARRRSTRAPCSTSRSSRNATASSASSTGCR